MKNIFLRIIITTLVAIIMYACANKAQGPTGGPKDETPPKVVRSLPLNGTLNFKKKEIQIIFDENIAVEKPGELIVISPPQKVPADIKSNARTVTVSFNDDLKDSTTYTVNFGNSIVDLNEKNPFENYRFAFSTGPVLDTLQVSGVLINAEDLNPMAGIVVGIHPENLDSAIFSAPFMRIGKTDENGRFTIDNIKPGRYRVYAIGDVSKDFVYQPGETVAFIDSIVTPTLIMEEKHDTLWKDSVNYDSIRTYIGPRYLPDNLVFKLFKETKKRQYFIKSERKQAQSFTLFFNDKADSLPRIKPLNFDWENKVLLQKNATLDTLTFWLKDSSLIKIDTLQMEMTYKKSDSLFHLVSQTDTINVFMRKGKPSAKAKKSQVQEIQFLKVNSNAAGSFDIYNPVMLGFDAPIDSINLKKIKLKQKVDTVYKDLVLKWRQVDSTKMNFAVDYKWEPETNYTFEIDSAAVKSIYGLHNNTLKIEFKIKSLEDYSAIKIIPAVFDAKIVFQVLDKSDKVLATKPAQAKGTLFEYLKPGDYYLRAFIDKNGNAKWDTGELSTEMQPEEVFYYPKKMSLRANWEFEETWDLNAIPLLQQKPAELKKSGTKKQGR